MRSYYEQAKAAHREGDAAPKGHHYAYPKVVEVRASAAPVTPERRTGGGADRRHPDDRG